MKVRCDTAVAELRKKLQQAVADRDGADQVCSSPAGNDRLAFHTVTPALFR